MSDEQNKPVSKPTNESPKKPPPPPPSQEKLPPSNPFKGGEETITPKWTEKPLVERKE